MITSSNSKPFAIWDEVTMIPLAKAVLLQTIRMVDAFINHGKDVEFVLLPRGRHTYDGVSAWYFENKLRSHFAKYLLGDFKSSGFYYIEINEYEQIIK